MKGDRKSQGKGNSREITTNVRIYFTAWVKGRKSGMINTFP